MVSTLTPATSSTDDEARCPLSDLRSVQRERQARPLSQPVSPMRVSSACGIDRRCCSGPRCETEREPRPEVQVLRRADAALENIERLGQQDSQHSVANSRLQCVGDQNALAMVSR